jgi:hypothetical protein
MRVLCEEHLGHIIHKLQTTPLGVRRDIASGRIFLPIYLQHEYMNSRGKNPRSPGVYAGARMSEDAMFRLIPTMVYELCEPRHP